MSIGLPYEGMFSPPVGRVRGLSDSPPTQSPLIAGPVPRQLAVKKRIY